ncbi:GTP-binding protein [Duganella sp. LX20W]|uniref:GTP-binding protein n=1 Tax=Rugamonas brunnea TaxID=2758569 RepID=A0A7W2ICY3_9BURK|nr:putative glycoside hydrolase [Rugamonas brunnea]MBA5638834.1 GTP-binding protein [Rugamonas brunnea]
MTWRCACRLAVAALSFLAIGSPALAIEGSVVSKVDQAPLAGAIVTSGTQTTRTDASGHFQLPLSNGALAVRAPGYERRQVAVAAGPEQPQHIALAPFQPKAVYLSVYGIGSGALRDAALKLEDQTALNALVIDVKGDRGLIPYLSALPLASTIGAQKVRTISDMPAMIKLLRQKNIYLIGRIVVFKDDLLATAHPELALHGADGALWHDREGLAWLDPMREEGWRYSLDVAEEAARLGFDEIQFDYVRFPDAAGLRFAQPNTQANRVAAITGFLNAARKRLAPYNVFVAADIFGYVLWNPDDTAIGQDINLLVQAVDYVCPMLYPSGFTWGLPGTPNPVEHPYDIVFRSLQKAKQRTGLPGSRFRPWLQEFSDYAFDRRKFDGDEVQAQIEAARAAGSNGWMLWNPRNHYGSDGLPCDDGGCPP